MRPTTILLLGLSISMPLTSTFVRAQAATGAGEKAPASASAPAAATEAEKPKIPGAELARPGGGFLGVELRGAALHVTFYDKDKKPAAADAKSISARWRDGGARFVVMLPSSERTLSSAALFRRPYIYTVQLALIGENGEVMENHSVEAAAAAE